MMLEFLGWVFITLIVLGLVLYVIEEIDVWKRDRDKKYFLKNAKDVGHNISSCADWLSRKDYRIVQDVLDYISKELITKGRVNPENLRNLIDEIQSNNSRE